MFSGGLSCTSVSPVIGNHLNQGQEQQWTRLCFALCPGKRSMPFHQHLGMEEEYAPPRLAPKPCAGYGQECAWGPLHSPILDLPLTAMVSVKGMARPLL